MEILKIKDSMSRTVILNLLQSDVRKIYRVHVEVKYPRLHQQMHFTNIRLYKRMHLH